MAMGRWRKWEYGEMGIIVNQVSMMVNMGSLFIRDYYKKRRKTKKKG